jgi:1-acyl-sn-glycerol-3-phosphate acyltransferase
VIALTPLVILFMLAFDLELRYAISQGKAQRLHSVLVRYPKGLMRLIKVCWGVSLKLDPRLVDALSEPGCTIVVANHRSPLDIPVLMYLCQARPPHFVCRRGLEQGIPGISPLVRHWCAVLSKKPQENEALLLGLGRHIKATEGVAVIFPEGRKTTRTYPDLTPFKPGGLTRLVKAAPDSRVVAVAIRGTHEAWPGPWRLPRPGVTIEGIFAASASVETVNPELLTSHCETAIRTTLERPTRPASEGDVTWTSSPTH